MLLTTLVLYVLPVLQCERCLCFRSIGCLIVSISSFSNTCSGIGIPVSALLSDNGALKSNARRRQAVEQLKHLLIHLAEYSVSDSESWTCHATPVFLSYLMVVVIVQRTPVFKLHPTWYAMGVCFSAVCRKPLRRTDVWQETYAVCLICCNKVRPCASSSLSSSTNFIAT